jgi:hypothetical protein
MQRNLEPQFPLSQISVSATTAGMNIHYRALKVSPSLPRGHGMC